MVPERRACTKIARLAAVEYFCVWINNSHSYKGLFVRLDELGYLAGITAIDLAQKESKNRCLLGIVSSLQKHYYQNFAK